MDIQRLQEWLIEIKEEISEISIVQVVKDDSEITNFMRDIRSNDEQILFAGLPIGSIDSQNEDNVRTVEKHIFFILEKMFDKATYQEKLEVHARTKRTVEKIIKLFINVKVNENSPFCEDFRLLDLDSLSYTPVWLEAGTDGWVLQFDLIQNLKYE